MNSRTWVVSSLFAVISGIGMAASATEPPSLFFEGDMVRGGSAAGATGATCVLASQFKRRESVVWRIRVRDSNGRNVDAGALKSLVVELPDGQSFPARFGPHPKGGNSDQFWSTSWTVSADYPTGTFAYKVVATDKDGAIHTWAPFNIAPSQLTIIAGDVTFTK